jgi:hypothetical protein
MELFRPDVKGDLVFFDLDTLIVGPLHDFCQLNKLAILRDFYRKHGLQSAVMYLPEDDRAEIWRGFIRNPHMAMQVHSLGGDQSFLEKYWLTRAARIQDELPGQVVSYKVHCKEGVPRDAAVICAHGKPKTWDVPEFRKYYDGH